MTMMKLNDCQIQNADLFSVILENFPDAVHFVDASGRLVYANQALQKLLGYSADELLKMDVAQLYADEIQDALKQGFQNLKETGEKRVESILKAQNGRLIAVEIRSFSVYNDNGQFQHTISISRDLRAIKELQESLIHTSRLAAVGEMAAGIVHDILNPLTVIQASNQMLEMEIRDYAREGDEATSEEILELCTGIGLAGKSIENICSHLRGFYRKVSDNCAKVNLSTVVADALFMTRYKITKSKVVVDNQLAEDATYLMRGAAAQLQQVFINLIGNACDAMNENSDRRLLRISIAEEQLEGRTFWCLNFADTGPGIPRHLLKTIFDAFVTTKGAGEGTGLGLSISRGIVSSHQGRLTVASEDGQGAVFSVWLPRVDLAEESAD
jgi:two-component system NtrC family sensor kinase